CWDADGQAIVAAFAQPAPRPNEPVSRSPCLAVSPDGKLLAAGSNRGGMHIWDAHTGQLVHSLDSMPASAVAFSPNGRFLAVSGSGGQVRIFGIASGRELRAFDNDRQYLPTLFFTPDGKTLIGV